MIGTQPPLQLWGGMECTVARIGDHYVDQVARTGHHERRGDLDRFAGLGLRTLRYPVLWERTVGEEAGAYDWRWSDQRLARLRDLGITPIVGLLHHGSGPRWTSLTDPAFPERLAAYAGAVAARYPWVQDYTPLNEPLTTARFSGLYGHWYPHGDDDATFVRALLNQCHATVLAMRAIRRVNPAARLVQTEDVGMTHSTPVLGYQARFENERRWLSLDLLCGRVDDRHSLRPYLRRAGATDAELAAFVDAPCPPDLVGVNHYITSERFLDHRLSLYPSHVHGGNGRHAYADVEAVRTRTGLAGPIGILRSVWERYRLPLAVTEAHLGATREDQLRWLIQIWNAAHRLRAEGGDVRAVTVWALLGSYDWDSLCTRDAGRYEPGVFDVRAPEPRQTALAHLVQALAAGKTPHHPVLLSPGWWRRPERVLYNTAPREAAA